MPSEEGTKPRVLGLATCRHCGRRFPFDRARRAAPPPTMPMIDVDIHEPVAIVHQELLPLSRRHDDPSICPDCGVVAKAYSTKGRTQYRKCPECGKRFKTMKEAG